MTLNDLYFPPFHLFCMRVVVILCKLLNLSMYRRMWLLQKMFQLLPPLKDHPRNRHLFK